MKLLKIRILVGICLLLTVFQFNGCKEDSIDSTIPSLAEYTQIDFEPSWSLDGKKIVYTHSDIDFDLSGIYIIDSNGNNKRQIVSGFLRSPDWSPDGNWIVFSQINQIFKIKTNQDSLTQLTYEGKNFFPKWSEDGNLIVYSNIDRDGSTVCGIWIMRPDGTEKSLITINGNYPEWIIGSSSLIYFVPSKNSEGSFIGDSLFQYSLNNNSKNLIAFLSGDEHKFNLYPNYSDNGIVFGSTSNTGFSYVYKLNLNGLSIAKLTNTQGWSPNLSSDKQRIIYTNRNPGNGRLWIMDKNGNGNRQLTN